MPSESDYLSLLGHVIGLNEHGTWSCSCGFSGSVVDMANHLSADISSQIDARLAEAKAGGLLPPRGQ